MKKTHNKPSMILSFLTIDNSANTIFWDELWLFLFLSRKAISQSYCFIGIAKEKTEQVDLNLVSHTAIG